MSRLFILFLFFCLTTTLSADEQAVLVLENEQTTFEGSSDAYFLEDPSRSLTFDDVTSPAYTHKFIRSDKPELNFGRSQSAWWIKLRVIDQSHKKWYLQLDAMLGESFNLYVKPPKNEALKKGSTDALTQQYFKALEGHRRYAWSLNLPQGEPVDVYMRVTNGNSIVIVPIAFIDSDQFVSATNKDYRLYGAIFIGMLVIAVYQLFMFVILREIAYLALSISALTMLITTHNSNPAFESLRFLGDTSSYFFLTPLMISVISTVVYTRLILDIDSKMPWLNYSFNLIIMLALIFIATVGAVPDLSIFALLLGLYMLVHIAFVSLYLAWKKRSAIAMYFFCIFLIPLAVHGYNLLIIVFDTDQRKVGTDTYGLVASMIFLILLAVVLAEKIRAERENMKVVEASAKAKNDFLAVMSHELRTPMNAIVGLGALLKFSDLDSKQKNYVEKLELSSGYMMQLVNNVLDFAKVKNDSFELAQQGFRLDIAARAVINILEQKAEDKGIELSLVGEDLLPVAITGDRGHLSQVLINLISNAIKYTEEGEVSLVIKQLAAPTDTSVRLAFTVSDTGVGIDAEDTKHLFDPYQRVINSESVFNEGVGLGLAISKSLVELMGGRLQVESKMGQGSRFYFDLVFETAEDYVVSPDIAGAELHSFVLPTGLQILLTDDAPLNRYVGGEMIKNMGGNISLASTGEAAIVQLQQKSFDVILMDISLPGKSGLEVSQWVRQHGLNQNVPIIALTAHDLTQVKQKCEEAGMDGFLSKPFDYQDLYQAICSVLEYQSVAKKAEHAKPKVFNQSAFH